MQIVMYNTPGKIARVHFSIIVSKYKRSINKRLDKKKTKNRNTG